MKKFEPITDFVKQLFGGGDKSVNVKVSGGPGGGGGSQVVGPGERLARSIEERTETSRAEVTIRDESGRAEVTSGELGPGVKLAPSGAF